MLLCNNGSHTNGSSISVGSWYNARAANVIIQSEITEVKDYTANICAHNWTLPTNIQMGNVRSSASTFGLIYYGYYASGSLGANGSHGYWWSRTCHGNRGFKAMYSTSGTLTYDMTSWHPEWFQVRCLAK